MTIPSSKDSLIEYPSRFPIKVMGANVDGFVHAVTMIARQFDPDFDAASVELRDNMVTAAGFFFPKMAVKTGNRSLKKIDTFTTSRLTPKIPRFFTLRDSSRPRGDRQIAE